MTPRSNSVLVVLGGAPFAAIGLVESQMRGKPHAPERPPYRPKIPPEPI